MVSRSFTLVPTLALSETAKVLIANNSRAADNVNDALRHKCVNLDLRSVKTENIDQLIETLSDLRLVWPLAGKRSEYT